MEANTTKVETTVTTPTPVQIEGAIATWTRARNSATTLLSFLNQGNCFCITRDEFDKWNDLTPERLHVYPAVLDGVMKFVLVDNVTDGNIATPIDFDFVFVKDYTNGAKMVSTSSDLLTDTEITVQEGLERNFRFQMTKGSWVTEQVASKDGIFQAFGLPYSDLSTLFIPEEVTELYVVIGLKTNGAADLILWNNVTDFSPTMLADMAVPVPPFNVENPETNYQLLVQS